MRVRRAIGTLVGVVLLVSLLSTPAAAHRCGQYLVIPGDRSVEVLDKCGPPLSREIVGFTLLEDGRTEVPIEEWVYDSSGGYFHVLTFFGPRFVREESVRKQRR